MLDDALLHGISAEQHRKQLLHYLKVRSRERLPIKTAKCTWFTKYCRYLDIVAGNGLLLVDSLKIKAIFEYAQLNKIQANRIGRWTMKMSEFNYFIEYAKGATHHMADVLSRAIDEPDSAWKKRAPIDNDDDFLSTPFMAFWPQVQYQYQCAMLCAIWSNQNGG